MSDCFFVVEGEKKTIECKGEQRAASPQREAPTRVGTKEKREPSWSLMLLLGRKSERSFDTPYTSTPLGEHKLDEEKKKMIEGSEKRKLWMRAM